MRTVNHQPVIKKNHMEIHWHDYADKTDPAPITEADLTAKASVIGRVGIMMLACGTGAWRVRSSMNELSELMSITCTVDIGLMSINYTCFDGNNSFSQSLCLTSTGVNTSQLNRLEKFISDFKECHLTQSCEKIHSVLDEIERIHGLYSPAALAISAALACSAFTFLLGGGIVEMFCRSRNRKLFKMQTFQTSLYFIFMYCFLCIRRLPYLYSVAKAVGDHILRKLPARIRIYLFHAVYHSRFSIYHEWDRPCKTGYAFWNRTTHVFPAHYNCCNYDRLDPRYAAWTQTNFISSFKSGIMAMDRPSSVRQLFRRIRIFYYV